MMTTEFEIYAKTDWASFTQALDRWNSDKELNLTSHGKNEDCSVWSLGSSLLTAAKLDLKATEVRLRPPGLSPPSIEANIAWNKIGELCQKVGWISKSEAVRLDHLDEMRNRFTKLQLLSETPIPKGVKGVRRKRLARLRKDAAIQLEAHRNECELSIGERVGAFLGIETNSRLGGPNVRTQERFEVFSGLKEENPTWTQAKVALEAFEKLGEQVTVDAVRNTYRLMGVKWERGDRIR